MKYSFHSILNRHNFFKFILVTFSFTLLFFLLISTQSEHHRLKRDTGEKIRDILKNTPYLWRNERYSVRDRILQQRKWIKDIAHLVEGREAKRILVEDDIKIFYGPKNGSIYCASSPSFSNNCQLVLMPKEERDQVPSSYQNYIGNTSIQILVSVRNAHYRNITNIPEDWPQIFYTLEPPHLTKDAKLGESEAWLASYWRGSDIPIPYGMWLSKQNKHELNLTALKEKINFKEKSKMGVAMISNCRSKGRLGYIQKLRDAGIEIDVIGNCGNITVCPRSTNSSVCRKKVEKEYKFYFAFENSRCEDYITEKLWDSGLRHNILPIVRGAEISNYKDALPPNSFIHVDEYSDPKELAKYLINLAQNEEEYLKYFYWKQNSEKIYLAAEDFFCRLCGMLYYSDYVPPPKWNNKNLMWKDVNKCRID